MTETLTFQDAVRRLEQYWAACGCILWQPHNVEVGAGTMNPATFLHVLGPEPWNVAYLEPSVRPDDARYGENPNRMARHHQLQVVLKPDPGDPQALYLESLAALGIDVGRHDVRFVEDNWESPALGAWGLGWEVWLDGLEITQFTYFQQAGSTDLDPVSVELTYGLERILMALQDVRHFKQLRWSEHVTFGDVLLTSEVETSRYYFEAADVERLQQLYDLYEAEAEHALEVGLVRPGHDYVLKCSHVFNVLDARGAVGVTERARFFGRMRRLARAVAEGYLAEREEQAHPLLEERPAWVAVRDDTDRDDAGAGAEADADRPTSADPPPDEAATFLLEVGTEELPVDDLDRALEALHERLPRALAELRLEHGALDVLGTPRRLVVLIEALAPRQRDLEEQVVGPPAKVAFDEDGSATPAAQGFARSVGTTPERLEIVERGGESRVAAVKREAGRPASEVLAEALPGVLDGLPFARSMRWNASGQTFARPVRWLIALHGAHVVPVSFAGLTAGRTTRGVRSHRSPRLRVAQAADYRKLARAHEIAVDPERRRALVREQVAARAEEVGGHVPDDSALVDEVTNLVEQPCALRGAFDADYLSLPAPVLITVMKKHQRYFPVLDDDGALLPHFVTVANGSNLDLERVRHGNEAVIRARFADAAYFWNEDIVRPLEDYTAELDKLTFQADLGSMRDKVERLVALVPQIGRRLGLDEADLAHARRAAALAKSDLVTSMVVDFTSLQGVMGRAYALRSGEDEAVAEAIYEQYLPRGADDVLPETPVGVSLALADRLDSLVGLFAAGVRPTGAQDPYALRRAALGITTILVERERSLDLRAAVDDAAAALPLDVDRETRDEVLDFLRRRLEGQLRDAGHRADVVDAVLAAQGDDPAAAAAAVTVLEGYALQPDWEVTLTAYARCARIVRGRDDVPREVDADGLDAPAAVVLYDALRTAEDVTDRSDIDAVLTSLETLTAPVNQFFDEVLVMADDPATRANRLALVGRVARLPDRVADLSHMEGF